jgi:hypothetical protein
MCIFQVKVQFNCLNIFNVQYFFIENKNNDFGAVIEFNKCHKNYDYYVFVNSSVRGPFL